MPVKNFERPTPKKI